MADIRSKALNYLRSGAVNVFHAQSPRDGTPAREVNALVQGHKGRYVVDFIGGIWSCTCGRPSPCPHVAAVQLVTGHRSPAAKAIAS